MRRLALVAVAALALATAPAFAGDSMTVTHWPDVPAGQVKVGDIVVAVSVYDGSTWQLADGVTLQAPGPSPTICGPSVGPTPPVG